MYETELPKTEEARLKRGISLCRSVAAVGVLSFIFAVLAILLLIAVVVLVFVYEFKDTDGLLIFSLIGAFAGGAILSGGAAYLLMRLSGRLEKRKDDYFERCDSEYSFFVGEGTLATFCANELVLHAQAGEEGKDGKKGKGEKKREVHVPYSFLRFFYVCTRKQPKESGEWSLVLEIPARFLLKEGKKTVGEPPMLVQTDLKPRLLKALEERNIVPLGDMPHTDAVSRAKFKAEKKFFLPNAQKRRRALMLLVGGVALCVVGVFIGIFWDTTVAILLGVFGIFLAIRSALAFRRARALFAVYKEGIFWRESGGTDSAFLKWEELEHLTLAEEDGYPLLRATTLYGAYDFPRASGVWEYLEAHYPEHLN